MSHQVYWNPTIQKIPILALCLLLGACASIVHGNSQDIPMNTTPAGARVLVNGVDKGITPTTVTLKRNNTYTIVFQREGYQDVTVGIDKKLDFWGAIVGNVFSWWIIGLAVDFGTGAAYILTPEEINVTLPQMGINIEDLKRNSSELFIFFLTMDEYKKLNNSTLR